jgi:hypothetical protein
MRNMPLLALALLTSPVGKRHDHRSAVRKDPTRLLPHWLPLTTARHRIHHSNALLTLSVHLGSGVDTRVNLKADA